MSKQTAIVAYTVKNRDNQKAIWTRIGAAWSNERSDDFTVQLNAYTSVIASFLTEPEDDEGQ